MSRSDLASIVAHAGLPLQLFQVRLLEQGGGAIVPGPVVPPIPLPDGGALTFRRVETCQGEKTAVYLTA